MSTSSSETVPHPTGRELLLALAACLLGTALVFVEPLLGGSSTLSFDPAHPLYPAPWARPVEGVRPPINPITSDVDFFVLPGLMRMAQLGGASSWDDAQLLGYPLAANLPFPHLHPLTWIVGGVSPVTALDLLLWWHAALGALLAYRAVRLLGGSRAAGAFGAVGFALSAWMFTRWHLPQITYTTAWWPGLVAVVERLRRGSRAGAAAEGAVWTALSFVSGFPQAGVAFVAGFGLLVVADRRLRARGPLLAAGAAVVLGLALAAPQLEILAPAYRNAMRSEVATRAATVELGLSPGALPGALLPELFGRPSDFASDSPPAPSMQAYLPHRRLLGADVRENVVENALYPGVLVLLLLPALLRRGADPRARRLLLLAALALLGALVFPWLVRLVPSLAVLGAAHIKRLLVLVAGCLPLAAALALDTLRRRRAPVPLVFAAVLVVLLGLLPLLVAFDDDPAAPAFAASLATQALRQGVFVAAGVATLIWLSRGTRLAGFVAAAVLFADLVMLAWAFNPFPPQEEVFPATESTAWLAERPGRVAVLGDELLLPPTAAALHGIRSVHGVAPLLSARTAQLLALIEGPLVDPADPRVVRPFQDEASLDHPLLDLLGVTTVVHRDPTLAARRGIPNAYENPREQLAALDRPTAGPRAFWCGTTRWIPTSSSRLEEMGGPRFDWRELVVIEDDLPFDPVVGDMVPARVEDHGPGRLTIAVDAPGPGIVVVTESWDVGWTATIDGEPVPVRVVDHALVGIELDRTGPVEVELSHRIPGLGAARTVSALAAGLVLLLGILGWRGTRRRRDAGRRGAASSSAGGPEPGTGQANVSGSDHDSSPSR